MERHERGTSDPDYVGDRRIHEFDAGRVEIAVRLVQEQYLGTPQDEPRKRQSALHTGGETPHAIVRDVGQPNTLKKAVNWGTRNAEHV